VTARNKLDLTGVVSQLAAAPTMPVLPPSVDLSKSIPHNPPESIQTQFVGLSYQAAFREAASFVSTADEWLNKHRGAPLAACGRSMDFGSGWGRITRMLLTQLPPTSIYAVDVDSQMTALVNSTLPGVNAITVDATPPTVLADQTIDVAFAFSVFSHLAPAVHDEWAREFGRLISVGGMVFLTVLDKSFLAQIADAQRRVKAGRADDFSRGLAGLFDEIGSAQKAFDRGVPAYAGVGGGGVRTGDYYGWTALPKQYVTRVWGDAGFKIVEWTASGVLFPQAMVGLIRTDEPQTPGRRRFVDAIRGRS
jgi:hypothetical protein